VGANAFLLVNPYLLKLAFDKLENLGPEQGFPHNEILTLALAIVGLAIMAGIFRFAMRRTIIWMSRKVEFDLRSDLFLHLLKLNPTFYHNTRTGDIMARSTNDVEAVRRMVGPGIMHIVNAFVSSVIAISFMMYLSPEMTLYSLIPLPFLSIIVNRLGMIVHKRFSKIQEYFSVLTAKVQENISGVRVVRAYNQEDPEINDFGRHNETYIDLNMKLIRVNALFYPILFTLAGVVNLVVLYLGGKGVIAGDVTLGTLVAFFVYLSLLIWPMVAMGWVVSLYQRGTASLDRINKILETRPEVESLPDSNIEHRLKGKVEFRNLDFSYNGTNVLKDINLDIEAGMSVGIVGPTGSGKTTLVSLISRLFPIPRGKIFVDDIDINDIDLTTLRRQVGFVPQEPFLFSDSIANNILFGKDKDADNPSEREKAIEAARKAVLDKDLDEFPKGYNTMLGERGITLSGGQKQRVSIARALVINPRILILDDATSAVDTETEHLISMKLQGEIDKRTAIVISHRASAVKDADLIIYMEDGQVAESGSHDELMAENGRYAELYRTQLLEEELKRM